MSPYFHTLTVYLFGHNGRSEVREDCGTTGLDVAHLRKDNKGGLEPTPRLPDRICCGIQPATIISATSLQLFLLLLKATYCREAILKLSF